MVPTKKTVFKEHYDVCVIGGGPAGMMAAGRAAELGASVVLIEKNDGLGKKLLITGGGRCNVTNDTKDVRAFLAKLKNKGKFLFSTFAQHAVAESLDFFNSRGMETKVENEGRVFPVSDSAKSVKDVLVNYIKKNRVQVVSGITAKGFKIIENKIVGLNVSTKDYERLVISADSYILATGGSSHPETGSTGEAFDWLAKAGHTIIEADAALVPIKIGEKWVKDLAGVSHQHVKLTLVEKNTVTKKEKRGESRVGRMLFTHFGISGPLAINFSKDVRDIMDYGEKDSVVELSLDVMPDLDSVALDKKIQEIFLLNATKKMKNAVRDIVTPAFAPAILELAKLNPEQEPTVTTREERLRLVKILKDMRMTPVGFLGAESAIVASGGVKLEEVDFKTMRSRVVSNLYLVGDVLDVERPSGGYSLQICWSTGFVAGNDAGKN